MGVYDHCNVLGTQTVLLERIAELFLTGSDHVVELLIVGREVSDPRVNYYVLLLSPNEQWLQSRFVLCALIFSEYEKALVQCKVAVGEQFYIDDSQLDFVRTASLGAISYPGTKRVFETGAEKLSRSIWQG